MTNDECLKAGLELRKNVAPEPFSQSAIVHGGNEPYEGWTDVIVTHGDKSFVVGVASYGMGCKAYDEARYVAHAANEYPFAAQLAIERGEALREGVDALDVGCRECGYRGKAEFCSRCGAEICRRRIAAAIEGGNGDA